MQSLRYFRAACLTYFRRGHSLCVLNAQAALLRQVEEKRAKKELELAAKRQEDKVERNRVIRALAEERAANRSR